MLKLIIVDDEKIIRETISTIIDWKAHGIELVRLCKNGLEAFNAIMDESPDIVMTDIKMPNMDGLQLIKNSAEMGLDIQFIILSGYGEFEYAKTAMQYGVKHYLLKPCNENQILDSIQKTSYDCYQKKLSAKMGNNRFLITNNMQHNVISSIMNDSISQIDAPVESIINPYTAFMDFHYTPYTLIQVFFLEYKSLDGFLKQLQDYCANKMPNQTLHGIYVTNTLLLFYKNYSANCQPFVAHLSRIALPDQSINLEINSSSFPSLKELLALVIPKIRRFSTIYYINNFRIFSVFNYDSIIKEYEKHYTTFQQTKSNQNLQRILQLLSNIDNFNFYRLCLFVQQA